MKKILAILLCCLLLTGCGAKTVADETTEATGSSEALVDDYVYAPLVSPSANETEFVSRFDSETLIALSDDGISVDGQAIDEENAADGVSISHDIIYYEDKDAYESGYPYGEGTDADKHTADEAAAHTVVNITAPGRYRVTGALSAGQLRIDLGDDAYEDPDAVVELILDNTDIICTVAPAVLFLNVYECDGQWSTDTAQAVIDTTTAGANLVLEGENTVTGAYVARIYKDKEGEKKLWKQDGAIYSYMSMNVYGPGSLDLTASNEGLDTELHLTIWGGDIAIRSDNDGINTNEDGVSVTTINGGSLHIIAGLGEEGDGIDSNGYLVINGGIVVASANPAADAGLDSDMGSYVNGGTVIALGSTMDWAESESGQVTMNLQFAQFQSSGSAVVVTREDGTVIFAYDPSEDEVLGENVRQYMGAVISCANFVQGESYQVWLDGTVTGSDQGGVYDATTVSAYANGTQMMYTGTDVTMGPGGMGGGMGNMGGFGGGRGEMGEMPEGDFTMPDGEMPSVPEGDFSMPTDDFTLPGGETMPSMPEGEMPQGGMGNMGGQMPEGDFTMPDGEAPELPDGETMPEDWDPGQQGGNGRDQFGGMTDSSSGNTLFYMQDMVNFFSGLTAAVEG